eukprot:2149971-Karenia_brevis.AAC.1
MTQSFVTVYSAKSLGKMLAYFYSSADCDATDSEHPLYTAAKDVFRSYGLTLIGSWGTLAVQTLM